MLTALFGTDGIRGRVGHSPVSPEDVLKIGWAAGTALKVLGRGRQVVLGKDTRVSGYLFESLLQAGFIAAGVDTALTGPTANAGDCPFDQDDSGNCRGCHQCFSQSVL